MFMYLLLAVLGLHCHVRASLAVASWGCFPVVAPQLLAAVASLVAERAL